MSPLSAAASSTFSTNPAHTLTMLARNSLESDLSGVKTTFSSWDNCMAKDYCKWPVIAAIIVGSLIALSLLMCAARCLCCGLECCCGCFACCNACCPSPRGGGRTKTEYVQAPQQAWPQPQQQQPFYRENNMAYPQTATFDAPSGGTAGRAAPSADALPAMPSWTTAQNRHVEDTEYHGAAAGEEGIAMGAVGTGAQALGRQPRGVEDEQRMPMLPPQQQNDNPYGYEYHDRAPSPYQAPPSARYVGGDLGSPTRYEQQPPYPPHSSAINSAPPRGYSATSHENQDYGNQGYGVGVGPGRPSNANTPAPSYHTRAPISPSYGHYGPMSPQPGYEETSYAPPSRGPTSPTYGYQGATTQRMNDRTPYGSSIPGQPWGERNPEIMRKPVVGSWRDV